MEKSPQAHRREASQSQGGMMTAAQYRSRARELRTKNPKSRAAVLYERLAKLRQETEVDKLADEYRKRLKVNP